VNAFVLPALLLIMLIFLAVCAWLIYTEPPERQRGDRPSDRAEP
jgi:hypothetical protein